MSGWVQTEPEKVLPCSGLTYVFYGPDGDGRKEIHRAAREAKARGICLNHCDVRMLCLERALVLNETEGVWGGMGEAERRGFRNHLIDEGYESGEVPEGLEFWAALNSFYRAMEREMMARFA